MIATVRIAPVERWCEGYASESLFHCLAGTFIQIHPNTMRIADYSMSHGCKARYWTVSRQDAEKIAHLFGVEQSPFCELELCEHVLEMD